MTRLYVPGFDRKITQPRAWDRKLWGVELTGSDKRDSPMLIGTAWRSDHRAGYPDEPSRVLLFHTRTVARSWCRDKNAQYAARADSCKTWRFRPVRVREIVSLAHDLPQGVVEIVSSTQRRFKNAR